MATNGVQPWGSTGVGATDGRAIKAGWQVPDSRNRTTAGGLEIDDTWAVVTCKL